MILSAIRNWLRRRKMSRIPGWAEADSAEAEARRKHRKVSDFTKQKKLALHAALAAHAAQQQKRSDV